MTLEAKVVPVAELTADTRNAMFRLMNDYYLNVTAANFNADLDQKQNAIILSDEGQIRGFSTWVLSPLVFENRRMNIIFSGDTIIEKEYWGTMVLPIAWGRLMLRAFHADPDAPLYWLLTSKGYKTYRYLPVFFKEFHPNPGSITDGFDKRLANYLGTQKYKGHFDAERGIVRANGDGQRLRPGVADPDEAHLKDEFVRFFVEANPRADSGDELLCLARCHPDNLKPFILRQLTR
jgi:hypothetical protein